VSFRIMVCLVLVHAISGDIANGDNKGIARVASNNRVLQLITNYRYLRISGRHRYFCC